jgi:rRNA maturation protein Nop10
MTSLPEDGPQERFEEFLRTYMNEQGRLVYWSRLQQMSINDETSLAVDFQDLVSFDRVFTILATEDPVQFLNMLNKALVSVLRTKDPHYVDTVDTSLLKIHIINYPNRVALRAVKAKHIGNLITARRVVAEASETNSLLVGAFFRCRICGSDIPQMQEEGRYTEPPLCPVCGKKTAMRLVQELSRFVDFQKSRIEELPTDRPRGRIPFSMVVRLEGDLAGVLKNGDEVELTGILTVERTKDKLATYDTYLCVAGIQIIGHTMPQVPASESMQIESEGQLEAFLVANPSPLGVGLTCVGRQVPTDTGRIDLLLEAPDGAKVVVELKIGEADDDVVAQIQRYLVWAEEEFGPKSKVRGVVVANGFNKRMLTSLKGTRYHIQLIHVSDILPEQGINSEGMAKEKSELNGFTEADL